MRLAALSMGLLSGRGNDHGHFESSSTPKQKTASGDGALDVFHAQPTSEPAGSAPTRPDVASMGSDWAQAGAVLLQYQEDDRHQDDCEPGEIPDDVHIGQHLRLLLDHLVELRVGVLQALDGAS